MKNIALIVISFAVLLASGTYAYTSLFKSTDRNRETAYSQALKDCADKIPDSKTAQGTIHNPTGNSFFNPVSSTEYSVYPAFDRCIAGKGFWHE